LAGTLAYVFTKVQKKGFRAAQPFTEIFLNWGPLSGIIKNSFIYFKVFG